MWRFERGWFALRGLHARHGPKWQFVADLCLWTRTFAAYLLTDQCFTYTVCYPIVGFLNRKGVDNQHNILLSVIIAVITTEFSLLRTQLEAADPQGPENVLVSLSPPGFLDCYKTDYSSIVLTAGFLGAIKQIIAFLAYYPPGLFYCNRSDS